MPDAWDDDWIEKGKQSSTTAPDPVPTARLSQAERRRQQAEFNKRLWESENTDKAEDNYFLQTKGVVPLKTEFKPTMKVLSRKPDGIEGLSLDDDDDVEGVKKQMNAEERMQKAQKDREEKQKAYEERRRQLFGKEEVSSNQKLTPKLGSPRNQSRVKGVNESRPSSAASSTKNRQLFDPNESAKPEALRMHKQEQTNSLIEPTREPRAPDGSGRGGSGFAPRGGRAPQGSP